jgi:tetratricopeptide (TPR) repeat protein
MDCRRLLLPAVWVLGGAVGCHQVATMPPPSATQTYAPISAVAPPPPAVPADVQVKKEADLPKRTPRAATCVAFGEFQSREALAPEKTPAQKEQLQDQARKAYQQAINVDPNHLPAYRGLARLYEQMNDPTHAVATYQKALKVAPKDASLWYDLGMCQGRQKEWEPAIESLTKAVEFDSENRLYVNTLGFSLARAGRYQDSLACFVRVNSEAQAHFKLAQMLQHVKQPELCKYHLQMAVKKDPSLGPAQQMLAQMEGRAVASVQPVTYVEAAKPAAPERGVAPAEGTVEAAPAATEVKPAFSAGQPVMLPPPPSASGG